MDTSACKRPPKLSELGTDLLHLTQWQVARAIALPVLAFVAYWPLAATGQWVPAILSLMALSFATYGSTSHDLVHGTLGLKRLPTDILLTVLEGISLRSGHAYQAAHLHHHARFPHEDDIEGEAAGMTLARASLEGVFFQYRIYCWALLGRHGKRRWIVAEGLGVLVIVLTVIALLPWTIIPGVYTALMIAGGWTIPLITAYLPHEASAADKLHQTRVFRGWIARVVAFDHLYHWEHHLYPAVPHQNWPRLARRLDPWLATAGIKAVRIGW